MSPELNGVAVFAPDGTMIGRIALPERAANLCFGGTKRNRLFMAGKPLALRGLRQHARGDRRVISKVAADAPPYAAEGRRRRPPRRRAWSSAPAMADALRFPPGFVWGRATSSCQIEGRGDRKADSIWDTFARIPGTIGDHSTPEIACDSYHRYPEDIALLKRLGVKAYRFSISWPRVLPEGTGQPDPRGLDYYDRVTDALLKAGIEPWVCLFHWDLPQALQDRGGWGNRDDRRLVHRLCRS